MSVTRGSHGETPLCICLPSHLCLAWGPLAYWEQNIQIGREKKKQSEILCYLSMTNKTTKALYYSVPRQKKYSMLDLFSSFNLNPNAAKDNFRKLSAYCFP